MQRNLHVWQNVLILLGLIAVVVVPLMVSGLVEVHRAEQAQGLDDHARAAAHFESATWRLPWRADLWERAGREALAADQPQDAIRLLQRAPRLSAAGWFALGAAYQRTGETERAMEAFRTSLSQGASAESYAGMAQVYREQGDFGSERGALQNQVLLDPTDASAQYRLGLLLSLTDTKSALAHLSLAAQLDAEYKPVSETLRSAVTLADLSPTETGRLVTLGRGLGLVGEWPLAAQAFQQAVDAGVENAEAWAWLGEARQHLGQSGTEELDHALQLDGSSVVVRGLRGLHWKRLGDLHAALAEYQAAAVAEPDNPAWAASLGETYARLGQLTAALASYRRATVLASSDATYWRLLATFSADYGVDVKDTGLPAAQKAVELAPEDMLAVDILGWSQLGAGQADAARKTLLKVVEQQPDYALGHYHLAMAYLQTGDRDAAYRQLRQAVDLDPQGLAGTQAAQVLKQYFP